MPTSPDRTRRSVRETVRRLFGYLRLLAALLAIGALIGFGQAYLQEKRYLGRLELATSGSPTTSSGRLPDIVQLRRLLLDPQNVQALLPGAEEEDGFRPNATEALAVRNTIELEPIFSNTGSDRVVWRMTTEIPAENAQAASSQLRHFAEQLQHAYDRDRAAALAGSRGERNRFNVSTDGDIAPAAFWTADDGPVLPAATQSASPGSREALNRQQADLEAEAQRLHVSLYGVRDTVSQLRQKNDSATQEQRQSERELQRRINVLNRFETKGETTPLPADLEADYPELAAARKRFEELRQQEGSSYARLTPSHPLRKAFEKNVQEARQALRTEQQEAMRQLRADVARLDQQAKQLRETASKNDQRIDELLKLSAAYESLEQQRRRQSEQEAYRQEAAARRRPASDDSLPVQPPSPPGPEQPKATTTPPKATAPEPRKLPETVTEPGGHSAATASPPASSGRPAPLLVAGPFVDARPLRPRLVRDTLLGGLVGLVVAFLLAYVRSGADQRIHTQADIAELNLGLEVFGSIPELKRGTPPVQFVERPRS